MSEVEQEIAEQMGDDETDAEIDTLEHPEGEPVDPDEAEARSETQPPRSQAEIDKLTKQLEAEGKRHENAVRKLMGEDFSLLVANPTDWTPGFIFNVPEMHPTPEALAQLHAILGQAPGIELRPATDAEACEDCNALGEVLTGSRKPGQETKPCVHCGGTGWKPKMVQPAPLAAVPAYDGNGSPTPPVPNQFQVADRWGRPVGHAHYGLEPASITA